MPVFVCRQAAQPQSARSTSPPSAEYALTPLGEELMPAIQALVEIGRRPKAARGGLTPA